MARRSTIDRLDPAIRREIDDAIRRGQTIDEITAAVRALGADVKRSAIGLYSKKYAALAARQRDMTAVAQAFGADFAQSDNAMGKMLIQLMTSIATRAAMAEEEGDDGDGIDPKDLHFYARAVKDIIGAAKIDADRDSQVRKAAHEEMKRKAAATAETAARSAGASEDTIRRVKADILGISL